MQAVWNFCKGKMVCETDEPKDETDGADQEEPKKGHGGCGAQQPLVRKEGLKLFVQYKRGKDEDEVRETLSVPRTYLIFCRRRSRYSQTKGCSPQAKFTQR